MRSRKEVFFPCSRVPTLLWTLYRRYTTSSLSFFVVRRVKRPRHANDHARDCRRETGDRSCGFAAQRSRALSLSLLNLKKKRKCLQSIQKEIMTPFPTVQSNCFSRLCDPIKNTKKYDKCHFLQRLRRRDAKGEDVFPARCETASSKSEHSRKNVNSFISRLR